ncbi:MAG: NHL repeat-containing protein, partial [Chthonomonadaceae bacterium]|nr:NHL repeat-containing protein [Chthonomonadaceae bacterium]
AVPAVKPPPLSTEEEGVPPLPEAGWRAQRLKAVEIIGEMGTGVGEFNAPTGIGVDLHGSLYVADSNNHRIQRIMPTGDVFVFGSKPGNANGEMWGPMDVAIDPDGQSVFVAEQGNQRIQCFRYTGQYVGVMGGFSRPSGVAFDPEGMLWIADSGNQRVLRLNTKTGQFIGGMDKNAGLHRPTSLACDAFGNVHITDSVLMNVLRYSYSGKRLGGIADNRKLRNPGQIAVDGFGRIYIAETDADRLHVFDLRANSIATFDRLSTKQGNLSRPYGVALSSNGDIYVSDTGNHRVVRLAWE